MENFKKLLRLAKRLELKYIIAEQTADASGIQTALYNARLGPVKPDGNIDGALQNELINKVAPFLDQLGIPASSAVQIKVNVSPGPNVSFTPLINPPHKAAAELSKKLLLNFSKPMMVALKNTPVTGTVTADWLGIAPVK